ncbi:hypothetical protein BDK51DRAFT_51990 [Blyttiomyces helicus]|uniref:Uncharacterized protein n=1 Tax=Blyttiomyces helicus TaxID=388810 RepID=A0A4V1IPE8_9FUNG|nr:hypothetical protein BDK51DRAFT_51990 [Blyttiomyces helicus]|eukprot:RKO82807.1 hypothetical protein BDK51DRAFT_51990 [Blyttiomyces helicus]
MEFVNHYQAKRTTDEEIAKIINLYTKDEFLEEIKTRPFVYMTMNEYLRGNPTVRPYYDYDKAVDVYPSEKLVMADLEILKGYMAQLHPGAEVAYASRSGEKYGKGYIVSLQSYVKGYKMKVTDIETHIYNTFNGSEHNMETTSDHDKQSMMITQAKATFAPENHEMNWEISRSNFDVVIGWKLYLDSNYCPKCKKNHESPEAYIQCNGQGMLTMACRQTDLIMEPIKIPDDGASRIFINFNTVVNNYVNKNDIDDFPNDFEDFAMFPVEKFANSETARACFDSLKGDTANVAAFTLC